MISICLPIQSKRFDRQFELFLFFPRRFRYSNIIRERYYPSLRTAFLPLGSSIVYVRFCRIMERLLVSFCSFKIDLKFVGIYMPTPHTIVIYGTRYIHPYHVPNVDISKHEHIPIFPVCTWIEPISILFHVPSIWNPSSKKAPTLRFISEQ